MRIKRANTTDIPTIQRMANVVFRKTYAHILSSEQMEYMIDWMYSTESLTTQISAKGKDFFIAIDDKENPVGYISIEEDGATKTGLPLLHLQKIYVMPAHQGSCVGRMLINHIVELLKSRHPQGCRIELNVNRENSAVHFYEKMGMRRDRQGDFPIGNGFYMNDYIYALDITP